MNYKATLGTKSSHMHISIFKPSKVTCNTRNQDLNTQTAATAWNHGQKLAQIYIISIEIL